MAVGRPSALRASRTSSPGRETAWAWSRRNVFYFDQDKVVTPDDVRFFANPGGGTWIRSLQSDAYWLTRDEWWHDPAGDNDNDGSFGSPVKNIDEIACRSIGGSSNVAVYTNGPLSDAEAAVMERLRARDPGRVWTTVNGALPVTPKFDYDWSNLNVQAGLWTNTGSAGATGNASLVAGTARKNTVASAGKLRNAGSVSFDGSTYYRTGNVAGLIAPITWVAVMRVNDTALRCTVDGNDGSNRAALFTSADAWTLYAGSGSGVDSTLSHPTVNLYHLVAVRFGANAATFSVNGDFDRQARDAGANMVDGVTIGAGGDNSVPLLGEIVRLLGYDGTLQMYDPLAWNSWGRSVYAFNGDAQ